MLIPYPKFMCLVNNLGEIHDTSLGVWILKYDTTDIFLAKINFEHISNFYVDAKWQRSSLDASDRLRM